MKATKAEDEKLKRIVIGLDQLKWELGQTLNKLEAMFQYASSLSARLNDMFEETKVEDD